MTDNGLILLPHQERVVAEKLDLDARLEKLVQFNQTAVCISLDFEERCRLSRQAAVMKEYSNILAARIEAFV